MSAKLDKAWRQYGEMHRLCSNGKNLKNVFLNRQRENNTCKYLVFLEPRYGLGNRILALVSAFMYALATDRVLLIEPKKLLEQLLCEPFPGSHWLLPRDFPTATIAKSPTLGAAIKAGYRNMDVVNLHLEHTHVSHFSATMGLMCWVTHVFGGWSMKSIVSFRTCFIFGQRVMSTPQMPD